MATTTPTDAAPRASSGRVGPAPALYGVLVFALFLAVYFLSGASALVYEVVWTRLLSLVFGVTLHAISAVLASFMAGLALGSLAAGRLADRVRAPLIYYAALEVIIGLLGLASLAAIRELTPVYVWLFKASGGSHEVANALRFALACGALLLPTAAMGATLPFIVRASLQILPKVGENVSLLYAVNTAGAALGTLAAGFLLVGQLGFQESVYVAAGLNSLAGVFALALALAIAPSVRRHQAAAAAEASPEASKPAVPGGVVAAVLLVMAGSGFCSLAYEVVWFRILDLFLNGTVYAFSIMLATFLVGLAMGSALIRGVIGRSWNWVAVLGLLQLLIAFQAVSSQYAIGAIPEFRDAIVGGLFLSPVVGRPVMVMALACVLVLLPLAVLAGMTFPVAAQALLGGRRAAGALIGGLNFSNTVGAIAGSLAGGFWLLPVLGSQNSLTALAAVNVLMAVALLWVGFAPRPRLRLVLPLLALGMALYPAAAPNMMRAVFAGLFKDYELIWFQEGIENTVSVQRHRDGYQVMFLNNRSQAFDAPAMVSYHELIGHLPMLLHPQPKNALVIGMGGGATPGAVSRYRDTEVDVVELSPSVVEGATYFKHINNDLHAQPNVHITVDDGRNFLLLTDRRYDVITADVIQAHHAGSGNLYSREYFELAKNVLRDDGVMVQWVNPALPVQHALITRTFTEVFPHVSIWYYGSLMIGSKQPQDLGREQMQRRFDQPGVLENARRINLSSAADLLTQYSGDREAFRQNAGPGPVLTDNRPLTEYFRSAPDAGREREAAGEGALR